MLSLFETNYVARDRLVAEGQRFVGEGVAKGDPLFEAAQRLLGQLDAEPWAHCLRTTALLRGLQVVTPGALPYTDHFPLAATLHDNAKATDQIRPLLSAARSLTPEETVIFDTHARLGRERFEVEVAGRDLSGQQQQAADYLAELVGGHHQDVTNGQAVDDTRMLQLVDIIDASLDVARPYVLADTRPMPGRTIDTRLQTAVVRVDEFLSAMLEGNIGPRIHGQSSHALGRFVIEQLHGATPVPEA